MMPVSAAKGRSVDVKWGPDGIRRFRIVVLDSTLSSNALEIPQNDLLALDESILRWTAGEL